MNLLPVSRVGRAACALVLATVFPLGAELSAQATKPAAAKPAAAKAATTESTATGSQPVGTARFPLTRPEQTDYAETSRYDDVIAYMKLMAAANPQIHLTTYGYTYEGRPLPLAVIGAPGATAAQVIATGKTRVYIQANIHAGEVEGKEATLWLLRSIAKGERNEWFKTMVLMINPIYNADGNERINTTNRGSQAGPVGGMGTRENALGFDLNRDGTKLETSEARSMAKLLTEYDPQVAMDLHTTDGSSNSGFTMTYETSLNPNNSKAEMSFLRDELLPTITKAVKTKYDTDWWYYGGVSGNGADRGWRSDAELAKPRYTSTYYGVRNILGLLTEAYSYASFKTRIVETYRFLDESLDYINKNGPRIREIVATANKESIIGQQLSVRQQLVKAPNPVNVAFSPTISVRNPYVADRPYRLKPDDHVGRTFEMLPFFGTTETTETSTAPRVWVIPNSNDVAAAPAGGGAGGAPGAGGAGGGGGRGAGGGGGGRGAGGAGRGAGGGGGGGGGGFGGGGGGTPTARMIAQVIDRLGAHGVKYTVTDKEIPFNGERFTISSNTMVDQTYQGTHKARTLVGAWEANQQTLPVGSVVIQMDQPLARLLFVLMDPRSDDGFMWWNILDPVLGTPNVQYYPVLRSMNAVGN
ncbi:MAG: M14 family zinc carboxypeptidase [Gemmatimonas sp.]